MLFCISRSRVLVFVFLLVGSCLLYIIQVINEKIAWLEELKAEEKDMEDIKVVPGETYL